MLQELIGIKNETGNVNIWFGRLEASRLTKIAIKKGEQFWQAARIGLRPILPADKKNFPVFFVFVFVLFCRMWVMYQQAMIWVFYALFDDVSFCQSFHS